jgi:hypothetical protein
MDEVRIYNTVLSDSEIAALAKKRPVADAGSASANEDNSVAVTLNGWSAEGSNVTYTVATQPLNGAVSGTAPNLTYTPDPNYFGEDHFYFYVNDGAENSPAAAVLITINGVQDMPEASAQSIITYQNESVGLVLSGVDMDGDPLSYVVTSDPAHGTLSGTPPNLTYTPSNSFAGDDSFTFIANDGSDDSTSATVSIWVAREVSEVIAAYDFDDGSGETTTSVTLQDGNVVASNYGVGSGLNELIDSSSNSLSEDFDAENNIFGTTNALSFGGTRDDFGFTRAGSLETAISQNEYMSFTVTPTDTAAMNLSCLTFRTRIESILESAKSWALYSSVDGFQEADVISNGQTTVVGEWVSNVIDLSAASFQSLDEAVEFRLYIYDGRNNKSSSTLFDKVILHGTVAGEGNSAPIADGVSVTTWEDTPVDITLTGSNSNGGSLAYTVADFPTNGLLSGTAPELTYTPATGYTGPDRFTFVVSDGVLTSALAIVTIQINEPESAISWFSAKDMFNTNDVSTSGSPVWAYSFGAAGSYVINGVAFTGESSPTGNADVITDLSETYTGYGNSIGTFSTLSAEYQSILESGAFSGAQSTTITLNSLNIGSEYEVQFWLNDSRNRSDMESKPRTATIAETSVVVDYNTAGANTNDGLGQSIAGTFTATQSSMVIVLNSVVPQLNAIQLRLISEPESLGNIYGSMSGGTNMTLSWTTVSGSSYAVEATTNLITGPWIDITNGITGSDELIAITNSMKQGQQFFRVYLEE